MTDELHDLTAAYALDALDADEARRYEAHLSTCEPCRTELDELRATASQLALTTSRRPPEAMRARVLAEVAATDQLTEAGRATTPRRRPIVAPLLAAAVVLAVVAVAGLAVRDLAAQRDRAEELVAVLAADDARTAVLEGTEGGAVRVVWSASSAGTVLVGTDLEPTGEGRTYELWTFADDGPRSAGVFEPGADGRVRSHLDLPAEPVSGWGVTIEPVGGTPEPEGDVIYRST